MLYSHACREKCLRSDELVCPVAEGMGGAIDDPKAPTTGQAAEAPAAEEPEDPPPLPTGAGWSGAGNRGQRAGRTQHEISLERGSKEEVQVGGRGERRTHC